MCGFGGVCGWVDDMMMYFGAVYSIFLVRELVRHINNKLKGNV